MYEVLAIILKRTNFLIADHCYEREDMYIEGIIYKYLFHVDADANARIVG